MNLFNNFSKAAFVAGFALLAPAYADQWNKKTIVTFNAPVEMPTMTLQPGSYTFKLLESSSNRHIVTVWDRDGMHHVTTVLAIPNYRVKPTDKTSMTFWEMPTGQAPAMRAWFYPGDNFGQEFAYPKWKAERISLAMNRETPPTLSSNDSEFGQRQPALTATTDTPAPSDDASPSVAQPAETIAPEPAPVSETVSTEAASPAPAAETAPVAESPAPTAEAPEQQAAEPAQAMPATASNFNEILLVGILTFVVGLTTFLGRKKGEMEV